ncbi:hypothetical protein EYF80_017906 [Liparis tanakae]|uniref:Uncharacterized protein n=1 Tax=Liparis tanakae TaxID=230148 RepID=A0A4Z2I1C8_9TELE|nr:hypothetical protein EYF80_017906 [Liparis tanakae]
MRTEIDGRADHVHPARRHRRARSPRQVRTQVDVKPQDLRHCNADWGAALPPQSARPLLHCGPGPHTAEEGNSKCGAHNCSCHADLGSPGYSLPVAIVCVELWDPLFGLLTPLSFKMCCFSSPKRRRISNARAQRQVLRAAS